MTGYLLHKRYESRHVLYQIKDHNYYTQIIIYIPLPPPNEVMIIVTHETCQNVANTPNCPPQL